MGSMRHKLGEAQRRASEKEKELRALDEKYRKLEIEKLKLSEKWVRASTKLRAEDKAKAKQKEMEEALERVRKEAHRFTEMYDRSQREVQQLRERADIAKTANARLQEELAQLRLEKCQDSHDKDRVDKVTGELLGRIKTYERELDLLREENRELVKTSSSMKQN